MEVEISMKLTLTPEEYNELMIKAAQAPLELWKAGVRAFTDPSTPINLLPAREPMRSVSEIKEAQPAQTVAKPKTGWPYPS